MNTMKKLLVLTGSMVIICHAGQIVDVVSSSKIVPQIQEEKPKVNTLADVVKPAKVVQKKEGIASVVKEISVPHKLIAVPNEPVKNPIERTVLVSNEITKDMITYKKHWTGNYTPSKFILMVNGQELKQEAATPIKVTDDKLCVNFEYEFKVLGKVHRAGGRKFEYILPKDIEKVCSTFSWDAPANLVLNKGGLVASSDTSY